MTPHDLVRLKHMRDAAETASQFISGKSRSDLDSDRMLLFALIRAVEIIGEAAGKVSEETRAEFPGIPWPAMVGMRNRLMHAYFEVDRDVLWTTVTKSLSDLLEQLKNVPR